MCNINIGDYVIVTLANANILEGELVKIGTDFIVIDDVSAFGDWVYVNFYDIVNINRI